jgi:hypothetical protein
MQVAQLEVGDRGQDALRVVVDEAVERVDRLLGALDELVAARDVHQRQGRVVAVGRVEEDDLEVLDAPGPVLKVGDQPQARLCAPSMRAEAIRYCSPIISLNRFVFG